MPLLVFFLMPFFVLTYLICQKLRERFGAASGTASGILVFLFWTWVLVRAARAGLMH